MPTSDTNSKSPKTSSDGKAVVKKAPVSFGKKETRQTHKPDPMPPVVDTPEGTIEQNTEEAAP